MAAKAPKGLEIRAYNVGFGDCFLLSFAYDDFERHVLIDFGSTSNSPDAPERPMEGIAKDIKARCKDKLHAIVVSHRHRDHISGFATNAKGTAAGNIIASCKPDVIVQPWTEDPAAGTKATKATATIVRRKAFVSSLEVMHGFAEHALEEATRSAAKGRRLGELGFIGQDNLKNLSAVKNLQKMGTTHAYVSFGSRSGLESVLPGVKISVLGPPTLEQTETIRKQRSSDPEEFWQLQGAAGRSFSAKGRSPFAAGRSRRGARVAGSVRWFTDRVRDARRSGLLELVRALDSAMNNTSLILLLEFGKHRLLFPGDAQIENWEYALSKAEVRTRLKGVTVYKVGHHGSRNATPRRLWAEFARRGPKSMKRMKTLISTLANKHGHSESRTEVPRDTLLKELKDKTQLRDTRYDREPRKPYAKVDL